MPKGGWWKASFRNDWGVSSSLLQFHNREMPATFEENDGQFDADSGLSHQLCPWRSTRGTFGPAPLPVLPGHRRLRRFSEDAGKLRQRRKRERMNECRRRFCERHNRRNHTWIHQAVALVTSFAVRQRCGTIEYDDTERSYLASFPWYALRDQFSIKCDELGISLRLVESKNESTQSNNI